MIKLNEARVALVHDFLTTLGGAERVLYALHRRFPEAPIYTLRYDERGTAGQFASAEIRPARLSRTFVGRSAHLSLPFQPNAIESFNLSEYDLVISSSAGFSKGVITRPETLHICYCHTPLRYLWDWTHEYAAENGYDHGLKSIAHRLVTHYLRLWDQASAERPDRWLANSANVAKRIAKYYHRSAQVLYPPVARLESEDPALHQSPSDQPYDLIVSRLSPYKRIDLAIEAAKRTKRPLVVIGQGSDRSRLENLAIQLKAPVAFLGYQDDQTIAQYYRYCQAFLFTGEDDFGLTPVEAMSFGKPVIAFGKGGALETVKDGISGLFFHEATVDSLVEALDRFEKDESRFEAERIRKEAERFSPEKFTDQLEAILEKEWSAWQTANR